MKKLFAILVVFALVLCMSVTAFAAPSLPSTGTSDDADIDTAAPTVDTPVYGYIGPDATITDPTPQDPDAVPDVETVPTDMSISVPVKLMWAAFASDGGTITSPTYTIENKSPFAVDVTLSSFEQTSTANAAIDDEITLSLTGLNASATDVVGMAAPLSAGTLTANGATASKTFTIGGTYTGPFATVYQPTYSMVLTFAIH